MLCLTLLRDHVIAAELYALDRAIFPWPQPISADYNVTSEAGSDKAVEFSRKPAIEGLKLTMPGDEMRHLLEQRRDDHHRRAQQWQREQARAPEQTDEQPLLPDDILLE